MELRELRRQLYYELPVGETVAYNGYEIERTRYGLTLHHTGEKAQRSPRCTRYAAHCEWALGIVTQPPPVQTDVTPVRPPKRKRGTYYGVSKVLSANRPWAAQLWNNGRVVSLGSYPTEEIAARAYDAYVRVNGLNKPLNFPDPVSRAS